MPLSEAKLTIANNMRINYKNENVLVRVTLKGLEGKDEETDENFEALCDIIVSEVLRMNRLNIVRPDKERGKIMNKLTDGQYKLHPEFIKQLNCPIMSIRPCGDWKMQNKAIAIEIAAENNDLRFTLIGNPTKND
jgi:hypothetical protein